MGAAVAAEFEPAEHAVTVAAFEIDETEVTVSDYLACVEAKRCPAAPTTVWWEGIIKSQVERQSPACNVNAPDRRDHPMNCVTWGGADAYCRAQGKRLPTEEEWEYAARGSDGRVFPWAGSSDSPAGVCFHRLRQGAVAVFEYTCPAGSMRGDASPFGVLDLGGNVREWTATPDREPASPNKPPRHIFKGGDWTQETGTRLLPWYSISQPDQERSMSLGFRCVR